MGEFKVAKKDMIVWKKATLNRNTYERCLVKLLLPKGTRYYSNPLWDTKCRAEKAVVLAIYRYRFKKVPRRLKRLRRIRNATAYSYRDPSFEYVEKSVVSPSKGFDNSYLTCASGIHFFLDCDVAMRYDFS